MAEITLVAEPGRATGTPPSKRLRSAGRIPAVVYGHGIDAASVSVDGRELRHALSGDAGLNQLLSLRVGGDTHLALARELQRHPVRHTVVHVDFQVVARDEVVSADVPVIMVGEAKQVEVQRGLIEHQLTSLTIHAKPSDIPNAIEIDVTDLAVGDTIRVADLRLPPGVTTEVDPEDPVVMATASSLEAEVAEADAEAAAAAAAEQPPEEGEEPAAAPAEEG